MKLLLCVASFISVAVGFRYADAAEKAAKPVVCSAFEVVRADLAVCSDGKKPFLLRQFAKVQVGQTVVLVGFR